MAATSTPFGLRPVNMIGGQAFNGGAIREIKMTANSATAIFTGDLVQLAAGEPSAMGATPTTSTAGLVGVCVGVRYIDPVMKYEVHSQFLPANAVNSGYTEIWIKVCDDPDQLFAVQASGAVTRAAIGRNAALTNFGAGSTATGLSKVQVSSTTATTATLAVRIVDLVVGPMSTPGDAYTDCIVKFNHGVHSYYTSTGA